MNILEQLKSINTFVFDVDGVLTNGTLIVLPNGVMARTMNIRDGYALQLAIKKGYRVVIISGGFSAEVTERLNKLGVTDVFMQVDNKQECLEAFIEQHHIPKEQVLFMGDDIPDLQVMKSVGVAACPADAATEIIAVSHYISPFKGGEGCGRDIIEKVLKLNDNWASDSSVRAQ